jgi:transcription termination/antitermination protein NusG
MTRPAPLRIDQLVRVRSGPFAGFRGTIAEIDEATARLKVAVAIYGRETPVELEPGDVEKL